MSQLPKPNVPMAGFQPDPKEDPTLVCLDDYARERALTPAARRDLVREFDLIAVQRKLKDAGRFVFIEKKRGDASFLRFVDPTLAIVADTLDRLRDVPELAALPELVRSAQGR